MKIKPHRSKKSRKYRLVHKNLQDTEQQTNLIVVANNDHLDHHLLNNSDDEDEGGDGGGNIGHLQLIGFSTELADSTDEMEIGRRLLEQEGEKQLAKVNAREKNTQSDSNGLGQVLKKHPNKLFDSQLFAGDFSPTDFGPSEIESFMRERAEQEKEKQLRLEKVLQNQNEYRNNSIPTPGM